MFQFFSLIFNLILSCHSRLDLESTASLEEASAKGGG